MKEGIYHPQGFSHEKEFDDLSAEKIQLYRYLLSQAKYAGSDPSQSGFYVRAAGITGNKHIWAGGNKEYGHSDAFIHGETAVVSGLRDFLKTDPIEAIGWYKEGEIGPDDFGRPCGNCRDILKAYASPDLVLLNGNENNFVYTRLRDFLFDDFRYLNLDHVATVDVNAAIDGIRGATDIYLPEEMKPQVYGAVLVAEEGLMWVGKHYTNVGYDSVTPGLSAVVNWQNHYPVGHISERHLKIKKVIFVSESGIPDVFYRDRQAVLELDEILRRYKKREPLGVDLVHAKRMDNGNMTIYQAKRTNTEEWLPHPFSPAHSEWMM